MVRTGRPEDTGKRLNSKNWVTGAFTLTAQSSFVSDVVCIDDCERCPLYLKGCAGKCPRWDDLVCSNCPCLASKYNNREEITTVHPETLEPEAPDPGLVALRELRRGLRDGEPIPGTLKSERVE